MTLTESELTGAEVSGGDWVKVCRLDQLTPDRGVAALVGDTQVAIFLLSPLAASPLAGSNGSSPGEPEVYVIDNRDPYSGANVMARGLVGSAGDRPTVASPIYKERFDLQTGACLDGEDGLRSWPVRIEGGHVEVAVG